MTIKPDMFLPELLSIEKPARYFGNEAGSLQKTAYQVRMTLCFPDIYEIGMCNNAMRILYSKINEQTDIFCDRVFAPKPDFGNLLTMKKISLFGLDSHEEIKKSDILGFSIGYELLATNILYVLDLAGISPFRSQRSDNDPIIIAGGPGITNPEPFIDFFDAVWIGEAETEFFDFLEQFKIKKQQGHGKNELLTLIHEHPSFYDGTDKPVSRNVHYHFGDTYQKLNFPVPCVRPVQEHAVVEIMRGCINGCRFCQAGYTYRPARIKNPNIIIAEVEDRVRAGYTTISLSSLSSGDYPNVLELLALLTEKYRGKNISFQLPSLKVESFDLEILQHISELKKSGLTFAIETARSEWQKQINKIVDEQKVYSILEQAKKYHFKTAKFYFMLGLPISGTLEEEAEAIIDFLKTILKTTTMEIHVTISMFVPKPHTPYENAKLANPIDVLEAVYTIKDNFKHKKQLKISYHNPYMAYLEYVIAHGTRNLSSLIMEAYKAGCVFDAWDDHFNKEQWLKILSTWTIPIGNELYKKIHMKVSGAYLKNEYSKSEQNMLTN
ncbi:MAG: radical SAM protein, partial [Spirochaetes bacterium]|nr:radical SAM protein [Spirochaetota bacterium]